MPFLLLVLVALAIGSLVTVLAAHYPHTAGVSQPSDTAARQVGHTIAEHRRLRRLRRMLRGRLDPTTATGLALSLALLVIIVAGAVIGTLAYLIRSNSELAAVDRSVGQWGVDYRAEWSMEALELFTWLGDPRLFVPLAETLGPSFPSGHSAGAAAFLGAVALLMSRGRTPHERALIFGVAAGLAAGVACSRVMLGVHWLSDTVAGVLFGWAWVCAVSIAFGGRRLRFGAPAEKAAEVAAQDLHEPQRAPRAA